MKKRIFALLTVLMLLVTAFAFAGCGDKNKDDEDGDNSKDVSTLSSKELFELSVQNSFFGDVSSSSVPTAGGDMRSSLLVDFEKLSIMGTDFTQGNKLALTLDVLADVDNTAAEVGVEIEAFGEKPVLEAMVNTEGVYVTTLLGLNKKPIGATYEELGIDLDSMASQAGIDMQMLKDMPKLITEISNIYTNAINANINDSCFTAETKTVTVDGKEIKDAKVITLTLTGETFKKVMSDALTNLKAIDNQMIKDAFADIDVEAMLADVDGNFALRVINTVDYDKTVALDIDIDADTGANADTDADVENAGNEDTLATPDEAATVMPRINITMVDGNFKMKVGVEGNETDGLDIAFVVGENNAATFTFSFTEGGETITPIKAEGTYANDKFDGVLTIDMDGQKASVKLVVEGGITEGKIAISELSVDQQGATVTFPIELGFEYSITANKVRYAVSVKGAMDGTFDIDGTMSYVVEFKDININKPASYDSFTELDQDTVMGWANDIQTKFPKIFAFINDQMNKVSAPNVDYDYDYDYNETW